jgi:hypothetical protein
MPFGCHLHGSYPAVMILRVDFVQIDLNQSDAQAQVSETNSEKFPAGRMRGFRSHQPQFALYQRRDRTRWHGGSWVVQGSTLLAMA